LMLICTQNEVLTAVFTVVASQSSSQFY